jgi:hypothetical protein
MPRIKHNYFCNQVIGNFTLVNPITRYHPKNGYPRINWICRCKCNSIVELTKIDLGSARYGNKVSCGCASKEIKDSLYNNRYMYALRAYMSDYKDVAQRRGFQFNLTENETLILIRKNCHYCKMEPKEDIKNRMSKSSIRDYVSLKVNGIDRIDSNKHYDIENVVPCCWICNRAKGNESYEAFVQWIQRISK